GQQAPDLTLQDLVRIQLQRFCDRAEYTCEPSCSTTFQSGNLDNEDSDIDDDKPLAHGCARGKRTQETWALFPIIVTIVDPHVNPRQHPQTSGASPLFYHNGT